MIHTTVMMFIQQLKNRKDMWKWLFTCPLLSWDLCFKNSSYQNYSQDCQFEMINCLYTMNAPCSYENCDYKSHQNKSQNWDFFRSNSGNQSSLQSQWAFHSHESCESSSQSAYHADPDDDINSHLTAYYVNQHSSKYVDHDQKRTTDHIYKDIYVNKAFSKHTYLCWACEKIFLMISQLKYHINEVHYNYLVFIYNDAVTLISYTTMQTSIDKLSVKSKAICLDSGVSHTLVDCSLVINHIHLVDENLQVYSVTHNSDSKLIFFKYINLCLYIHSDNRKSKVFVACKTYMMNRLNADIFIDMNVMQSEEMILDCEKDKLIMNSHYDFTTSFSRFMKKNDSKWAVTYHYKMTTKMEMWCCDEFTHKMPSKNWSNWVISHIKMHIKSMMDLHTNSMSTNPHSHVCCTCTKIFQSLNSLHEHLCISDHVTSCHSWQSWQSWHTDRLWRKIVDGEIIMGKTTWDILMQRIIA